MRKFKSLIGTLIVLLSACFLFGAILSVNNIISYADEFNYATDDIEVYSSETVKGDFTDDCVIVVLESSISQVNKVHRKSFFVGVNIEEIIDLTWRSNNKISTPDFRQILKIVLKEKSKNNVLCAVARLKKIKGIYSAEPNYLMESAMIPTDEYFVQDKLWGLNGEKGINAPSAWNITTGSKKVRVGIIDTGISNHSDLNDNLVTGYDFFNGNSVTTDDTSSHGTHVAGTIGATANNNGVVGVNWNVSLIPMQAANVNNKFEQSDVIRAIEWAISKWGTSEQIDIINYSVLGFGERPAIREKIRDFKGLFVWCAGNEDSDIDSRVAVNGSFDLPNLISVGAIKSNGERPTVSDWGYDADKNPLGSNYSASGKNVNIYAPGDKIYSTVPNNNYSAYSGTSMAAPHVAGVAALLLSKDPTLTAAELKKIILNGSDTIKIDVPSLGEQSVKKLNAYKAMDYLMNKDVNFSFEGGMGSKDNPFQITTEQQFKNINAAYREVYVPYQGNDRRIDYAFELMNDIVITDYWTPFEYKFTGSFDGGGHSITYQTKISSGSITQEDIGLFGFITAYGEVKNLTLANCHITLGDDKTELTSSQYLGVGILAGSVYEGKITNVTIKNSSIFCNTTQSMVGGIAGSTNHSDLYNCVVAGGNFAAYNGNIGGMSGSGAIYNFHGGSCYATVTKYNYAEDDRVGKIVGNEGDACGEVTDNGITVNKVKKDSGTCIAEGTLITLADGRQVPVESLTGNESLLVWNLYTGAFDTAPILFIDKDASAAYKVINLAFSDGTGLKVISEHGLWDYNLNRYVYLDEDAAQYIGHWFNKQTTDGNVMTSSRVQLTGVTVAWEETAAYSPVTYGHLCYYVNGMLSMPGGIDGLFNIFEVDADTMQYDAAAMEADIAQYGLFTYEEFAQILNVPQEVYDAFNAQYFKVAIGKGIVTEARLAELATRYASQLGID